MKLPSLFHYDIKQWRAGLARGLWALGEHSLPTTLAFVALAAGIAGLLFTQYVIFSPQNVQESAISEFAFREELFFELIEQLEQEEAVLETADTLQVRDIFNP